MSTPAPNRPAADNARFDGTAAGMSVVRRPVRFVAKSELAGQFIAGVFLRRLGEAGES